MPEPDGPLVIVPLLRCLKSWQGTKHFRHTHGKPPPDGVVYRCDGEPVDTQPSQPPEEP